MTEITRELLDAVIGASGLTSLEHDLAAALRHVLDLHHECTASDGEQRCHADLMPWPCATVRILPGTQTDDGAGADTPADHPGAAPIPPAPSSLAAERDALAAENARLRAQVQAVEALCTPYVDDGWSPVVGFVGRVRAALATTDTAEEVGT